MQDAKGTLISSGDVELRISIVTVAIETQLEKVIVYRVMGIVANRVL